MPAPTLAQLRRHAIARSLFAPTTLPRAIARLGFVQADPLRAPARAQDLTLFQRVAGYRAGDLDRRYARLGLEEDFFVNYGVMPRALALLLHPRAADAWPAERQARADALLAFVRARGVVHPREVHAAFDHGTVLNWFGGNSRASTELLDALHHRGWLRTAGREGGVRLYAARPLPVPPDDPDDALDRLADVVVGLYAPLPERSLSELVRRIRYGAPQWTPRMSALLARTRARLPQADVAGTRWFWPAGEGPGSRRHAVDPQRARLLAPFDPLVWDRRRFEAFWGWAYRFEAYTPAAQRVRGHYALPLLWGEQVVGWGNLAVAADGVLDGAIGLVQRPDPALGGRRAMGRALDEELARLAAFLGAAGHRRQWLAP